MNPFKQILTPIKSPETGLGRSLYDLGQWLCDNLSVVVVVVALLIFRYSIPH